jgi:hypothetical protein
MAGGFNDIDALRRVQHLVEEAAGFQAQKQKRKIDIVESAVAGFERMIRALFLLQAHSHLPQVFFERPLWP